MKLVFDHISFGWLCNDTVSIESDIECYDSRWMMNLKASVGKLWRPSLYTLPEFDWKV
jgi:hypothetical protein